MLYVIVFYFCFFSDSLLILTYLRTLIKLMLRRTMFQGTKLQFAERAILFTHNRNTKLKKYNEKEP